MHMTEAEVTSNFAAVLKKLQQGAGIVAERGSLPGALIKPPQPMTRTPSQCIAPAEKHERERGYPITLDPDSAADPEEIVRERKPWNPPPWDKSPIRVCSSPPSAGAGALVQLPGPFHLVRAR